MAASRDIKKEKALLTVDERHSKTPLLKGGLQLNFGGIGVKLRMKGRGIEEGIHINQLVRSELAQGHLVVMADCLVFCLLIIHFKV